MTERRPKVLLVMQNLPLESPFLTQKFISLSKVLDVHLLVWDTKNRFDKFIQSNSLDENTRSKIHFGTDNDSSLLVLLINMLLLLLRNSMLRSFLLKGKGTIRSRVKLIAKYLPLFTTPCDIIHFEFGTLAKDIAVLRNLTKAKLIVSFRGYDLNYIGLEDSQYYNGVWNNAHAIHFLGKDLKQRAISRGYKQDKLEALIPPAVDTSVFYVSIGEKRKDKIVITSVGRLTWKKGFEYGIQAMALLKKRNVPFEYNIIGSGPHMQALQFTIRELGLEQEIKLLGGKTVTEIKELLSQSHVFLHPAISEGFCNAVLEAQAMGVPVVCTDADGLRENIADNETGFIVPKWDVTAMADKIEWLWSHPVIAHKMGKAGNERVRMHFKIEKQINSFIEFYNRVYAS